MIQAGGGNDEYAVEAGQLNQSFVGLEFGYNTPVRTIYGRLAGVAVAEAQVTLWLAGAPTEEATLAVPPSAELYFSRYTGSSQILDLLERIEKHLDAKGNRR